MDNDTKAKLVSLLLREADYLEKESVRKNKEDGGLHGLVEISASKTLRSIIECLNAL